MNIDALIRCFWWLVAIGMFAAGGFFLLLFMQTVLQIVWGHA